MDTSEKYIEMCQKAREIQKMRILHRDWGNQDFYLKVNKDGCYDIDSCNGENFELLRLSTAQKGVVWLPRQDQLQEIMEIDSHKLNFMFNKFTSNILLSEDKYYKFYQQIDECCEDMFTPGDQYELPELPNPTFEQLWLAFVMKENFEKEWDVNKKEWIKINN
jgi:hypothetical protein